MTDKICFGRYLGQPVNVAVTTIDSPHSRVFSPPDGFLCVKGEYAMQWRARACPAE